MVITNQVIKIDRSKKDFKWDFNLLMQMVKIQSIWTMCPMPWVVKKVIKVTRVNINVQIGHIEIEKSLITFNDCSSFILMSYSKKTYCKTQIAK